MDEITKRKQSFLLRLPLSVREEAIKLAMEEGTSLNFFISMAVAEKITQLEARRKAPQRTTSVHAPMRPGTPQNIPFETHGRSPRHIYG